MPSRTLGEGDEPIFGTLPTKGRNKEGPRARREPFVETARHDRRDAGGSQLRNPNLIVRRLAKRRTANLSGVGTSSFFDIEAV